MRTVWTLFLLQYFNEMITIFFFLKSMHKTAMKYNTPLKKKDLGKGDNCKN